MKVSGKQVLRDCMALAKDACLYLIGLSSRVYNCVKAMLVRPSESDNENSD